MADYCTEIYEKTENTCIAENEAIFAKVVTELIQVIPYKEIEFIGEEYDSMSEFLAIKDHYIYTSPYLDQFFSTLKKYKYREKQEIKDAIFQLGHLRSKYANKKLISSLINSPYIEDITFDGFEEYKIYSKQFGEIKFSLANEYFYDEGRIQDYMYDYSLPNQCHNHTHFLSGVFPNDRAIISLIPSYFVGEYYHSYTHLLEENAIVDFCYNAIIPKETYEYIYEPRPLAIVPNKDLNRIEKEILKITNQPNDRCAMLTIGLYNQYLEEQKEQPKVYIKP